MAKSGIVRNRFIATAIALAGCGSMQTENPSPQPLFREAAEETGLIFHHFIGATGNYYLSEIMGPGVALLDYDVDGDLDVYLLQGAMLQADVIPSESIFPPKTGLGNRLFENRLIPDGTLSFTDATEGSGLGIESIAMGVAVGDYDGDANPDIYLTNLGPNILLRNSGRGVFEIVEGPQDERWSTSATFLDYDSDGDLDLFFANFVDFSVANNKECFAPTGERDYCIPTMYNPVNDRLFRNDAGEFKDVSATAGLAKAFGNGLGVIAADLNNDNLPDIYVANDTTENQLWLNVGNGQFEDRAMAVGAAVNADGRVEAGMGVVAEDFDNDGDEDLLMTHNIQETNTLYLNGGNGLFLDATNRHGLGNSSLPYTGFGIAWADFDHDGQLDVFVANGAVAVMEEQRGSPFPFLQANQFYRGTGKAFESTGQLEAWGNVDPQVSRGLATGDIDLDGDLDVVIANCNGPARLYLNQTGGDSWLRVMLEGQQRNRFGIGSRVGLCFDDGTCSWRRIHRDGSYLSSGEPVAHFGVAKPSSVSHLEVRWASERRERHPVLSLGTTMAVEEGTGVPIGH